MDISNAISAALMGHPSAGTSQYDPLSSSAILHDRCVQNTLRAVPLDAASLKTILGELQNAIVRGVQVIREHTGDQRTDSDRKDSIYVGHTGIALTLLRLFAQSKSIGFNSPSHLLSLLSLATDQSSRNSHIPSTTNPSDLIAAYLPTIRPHHPRPNRLSPLDSSVGPALVYVLNRIVFPDPDWSGAGAGLPGADVRGAGFDYGKQSRRASYGLGDVASGYFAQEPPPDPQWDAAMVTLRRAVQVALKDSSSGCDEVLYGRAGLLAGLLNLRAWLGIDSRGVSAALSPAQKHVLLEIVGDEPIGAIIAKIVDNGEDGRREYERTNDEEGLPMMWEWHGKWYLGAIHGVAGILTVLLQSPRHLITPYLHMITSCITSLCALTIANNGHLPSALPTRLKLSRYASKDPDALLLRHGEKPPRKSLVQICHGSPGLLILLATMRTRFPADFEQMKLKARVRSKSAAERPMELLDEFDDESLYSDQRRFSEGRHTFATSQVDWSEAERLASDRVWEEGLLRKGLGICHGVSGNGWTVLLSSWSSGFERDSHPDLYLSRSLAFLLHSTHIPPMPTGPILPSMHDFSVYRRPDHPYSLFEGLAGAVCAWADACVVIRERLEGMGTSASIGPLRGVESMLPVPLREINDDDLYASSSSSDDEVVRGKTKGKQRARGNRRDGRGDWAELDDQRRVRERRERGLALMLGIPGLGGARIRGIL